MKRYCDQCKTEHSADTKKCPGCGRRLKDILSEEKQKDIQKQNDDFTVINTMLM